MSAEAPMTEAPALRHTSDSGIQDRMERSMTVEAVQGKTVLITGANRGIGHALMQEALRRGAARVYAATRGPFTHTDPRVRPVRIDLADVETIRAAAEIADEVD